MTPGFRSSAFLRSTACTTPLIRCAKRARGHFGFGGELGGAIRLERGATLSTWVCGRPVKAYAGVAISMVFSPVQPEVSNRAAAITCEFLEMLWLFFLSQRNWDGVNPAAPSFAQRAIVFFNSIEAAP